MKSPQIIHATVIEDKERYSDLQVLLSGAGYYIGTLYNEPEGYEVPGTRDSVEYFASAMLAENALRAKTWTQRWSV